MNPIRAGCLGVGAALCCLCLAAESPGSDALVQFMYAKLSASFTPGSWKGSGAFLILANPGIGITEAELQDTYEISALVDQIPALSMAYSQSGFLCSEIYGNVLDRAQTTKFQKMADRERAIAARLVLFDKSRPGQATAAYAAYLQYESDYVAALDAKGIAEAEYRSSGAPVPGGLEQAVATALKNWRDLGHKEKIETAEADLQAFFDTSTRILFQGLKTQFLNSEVEGRKRTWHPVLTHPPLKQWLTGPGWRIWRFHVADARRSLPKEGALPPLQGFQPDAIPPRTSLDLSVEVKRVTIARPWMDMGIFSAHTWFLPAEDAYSAISAGDLRAKNPGVMPIVVTGLLLARNLTLTGSSFDKTPARVGPFAVKLMALPGRPAPASKHAKTNPDATISAPDPQIIGFFCQTVPKSPTPEPKYFK
jgi:hypothetical protein